MTFQTYFEAFDIRQMLADYPVGDAFTARYRNISRDEIHAIQDRQFVRLVARGWEIPFYQRLWGAMSIEPGDIKSLADITNLVRVLEQPKFVIRIRIEASANFLGNIC